MRASRTNISPSLLCLLKINIISRNHKLIRKNGIFAKWIAHILLGFVVIVLFVVSSFQIKIQLFWRSLLENIQHIYLVK